MPSLGIVNGDALLLVRPGRTWTVEVALADQSPESIAIDPSDPSRIYVGTRGNGLWRSADAGRTWEPAGGGIPHPVVTAVGVAPGSRSRPGRIYVGTEPSTVSRSDDGGSTWKALDAFLDLPSADTWSFPPQPETHHVRWIEVDRAVPKRVFVAVEAGALVRSLDGGDSWLDRARRSPIDTHTAATHAMLPGRLVSAAGDGYFETSDGGAKWRSPMAGLEHEYLVGIAMDPGDPATVIVSAAYGPSLSYSPRKAQAFVYRRFGKGRFRPAMEGLPRPKGTVASRLAPDPARPGVIYAANNHGVFQTGDGGKQWGALPIPFPPGAFRTGVGALVAFEE